MGRYLLRLLLATLALLAGIAFFNWFINPYGYFDAPRIEGVNTQALGFNHRLRLAKALAVEKIKPATVILGNSRAEAGYDPEHPGFTERPVYNLAMGGAGLGEMRRYLQEAIAVGNIRHIIIALDFTMFDPGLWSQGERATSVLLTDYDGRPSEPIRRWRRLAGTLLHADSLADSWWSLTHQKRLVAIYLPSGIRDDAADLDQVRREGGVHKASLNVESTFLSTTLLNVDGPEFHRTYQANLEWLLALARRAHRENVRLTLLINPIHARQTYLFEVTGLWAAYEKWKRDLTELTNEGAELWDFSGITDCTAEALPRTDDPAGTMRWYRESSHFRSNLGNEVLKRILQAQNGVACRDFGQRLGIATLASTLATQRGALLRWTERNPEDREEIRRLATAFHRP